MPNEFMKEALKEAKKALDKNEVPIGAVIVKQGEIIARAHNLKETLKRPTAHAEILAIERASQKLGSWRLNNCEMYVTLEPCHMCAAAIIEARINRLIYSAMDLKMGAHVSNKNRVNDILNNSIDVVGGVQEKESEDLLKLFFQTLRNDKDSV